MGRFPEKLLRRAREGGIDPPREAWEGIRAYRDLLREKGELLALLSAADLADPGGITRHLEDALHALLLAAPEPRAPVLDFGAGGGIVGAAWAILRPDLSVTLLESKHRKALFLAEAVRTVPLPNARVHEGRGDDPSLAGAFALVASRGVPTDRRTLVAQARLLRSGGRLLLFKGPESAPAARLALRRAKAFGAREETIRPLGDEKKRIYILATRA